jgi:hypothetical protein
VVEVVDARLMRAMLRMMMMVTMMTVAVLKTTQSQWGNRGAATRGAGEATASVGWTIAGRFRCRGCPAAKNAKSEECTATTVVGAAQQRKMTTTMKKKKMAKPSVERVTKTKIAETACGGNRWRSRGERNARKWREKGSVRSEMPKTMMKKKMRRKRRSVARMAKRWETG